MDLDQESLYGFTIYQSAFRQQIIEFCGWSEIIRPQYKINDIGDKNFLNKNINSNQT